jgi:hypothetical protein
MFGSGCYDPSRETEQRAMSRTNFRISRWSMVLMLVALVAGACSSGSTTEETQPVPEETVVPVEEATAEVSVAVVPDYSAPTFTVNVTFTDEGYEPDTIFIPAGRQVRLVLRNRGSHEHHYRVVGLIASDIRWLQVPDINEDEILAMEGSFIDDAEHILHHIEPEFVPFKAASLSGIRPLATEVHGYAQNGTSDVVLFFPLQTGTFTAEDVRYPEITGRVIVFDPAA